MAHLKHFKSSAMRDIEKERTREAKKYKNFVDPSRTALNFGYGPRTTDEICMAIRQRVKDVLDGQKLQKNADPFSSWCVTYPAELCTPEYSNLVYKKGPKKGERIPYNKPNDPDHVRRFFDEVYKFTVERYGIDDVIDGSVHMDETTPHMDIDIVNTAISRKTGRKTISSASKWKRAELANYQRDLQKHMVKVFGPEASHWILNGRTKGNYTIEELKARAEQEAELRDLEQRLATKEAELQQRDEYLTVKAQKVSEVAKAAAVQEKKNRQAAAENAKLAAELATKSANIGELIEAGNESLSDYKRKLAQNGTKIGHKLERLAAIQKAKHNLKRQAETGERILPTVEVDARPQKQFGE